MSVFAYVWLTGLIDRLSPLLIVAGGLALLYVAIWAVKQLVRNTIMDVSRIYGGWQIDRLNDLERRTKIEAEAAAFRAKLENERMTLKAQLAAARRENRLATANTRAALKAGVPPTVNERFAAGEFDVEID